MALSTRTVQYITQLGLLSFVEPVSGPEGSTRTAVYKLVPTNCWYNGYPFPHEVQVELKAEGFNTFTNEGLEYWLVPDAASTNSTGELSFYARKTTVGDLLNPPGGGVNRAPETFDGVSTAHTVDANAVSKYVKVTDNWEQARQAAYDLNDRVLRQIDGAPAETEVVPEVKGPDA